MPSRLRRRGRSRGIRLLTERTARGLGLRRRSRRCGHRLTHLAGRRLLHLTAVVAHLDLAALARRGVLQLLRLHGRRLQPLGLDLAVAGGAHLDVEVDLSGAPAVTVLDADGRVLTYAVIADGLPLGGVLGARAAIDDLVVALAGCGC